MFRYIAIPPGATERWAAGDSDGDGDDDGDGDGRLRLRQCSLVRGALRVVVGDGSEFAIGCGGMWRVRGGERCAIANPYRVEAVVHVTEVDLDLLGAW